MKVKQQGNDFVQISLKAYGFNKSCIKVRCCFVRADTFWFDLLKCSSKLILHVTFKDVSVTLYNKVHSLT